MDKAEEAVRGSRQMQADERLLGSKSILITTAPGQQKGGFIVQSDQAAYFCVQGRLGMGKVKEVHRLAVSDVLDQRARPSQMSRGAMDVMFMAPRNALSLGMQAPHQITSELGQEARVIAVTFRTQYELSDWGSWWDQAVRQHRADPGAKPEPPQANPEIRALQERYANLVAFGAQLAAEYQAINEVYGRLRDLGADADPALVEREKAKNAEYMIENPWMDYYEPHLDPEAFEANR